jgi:hypothetical protein
MTRIALLAATLTVLAWIATVGVLLALRDPGSLLHVAWTYVLVPGVVAIVAAAIHHRRSSAGR